MSKSTNMSQGQIQRQRQGAVKTALIVGAVALGIFLLTLYLNFGS